MGWLSVRQQPVADTLAAHFNNRIIKRSAEISVRRKPTIVGQSYKWQLHLEVQRWQMDMDWT